MIICKDTSQVVFKGNELYVSDIRIENVKLHGGCTDRIKSFDKEADDTILHCIVSENDGILFLAPDNEWKSNKLFGYIRRGASELTFIKNQEQLREALG